jgi:CBS domain-containing protein
MDSAPATAMNSDAAAGQPREVQMDTRADPEEQDPDEHRGSGGLAPTTVRDASTDVATLPVSAVMTTRLVVTVPDDDLMLAWEMMIRAGIRHLPVVDGDRLVGMIDERQLIAACALGPLSAKPRSVQELVDHPPLQVRADTSLREAAARMTASHVDVICVTTPAGGLRGVVTTSDLLRALAGRSLAQRDGTTTAVTPMLFRFTPVLPATR